MSPSGHQLRLDSTLRRSNREGFCQTSAVQALRCEGNGLGNTRAMFPKKIATKSIGLPPNMFCCFFLMGGWGVAFFVGGGGGSQISRDLCFNRLGATTTFGSLGIIKPLS